MPVRTRRQAAAIKSNANEKPINESDGTINMNDCWDIPETNLKASVIKTYSKKQPFRTWTSVSKKSSQDVSSKPESSDVKPGRTKLSERSVRLKELPSSANDSTNVQMSGCATSKSSTAKESRNKTRLAVQSMMACTMLPTKPGEINHTTVDMSLCSMVDVQQDNRMIKNSTVLADNCNINQELIVPNDISAIEGQNELQDTVISNYNEQTPPEKQPIQTAMQSVKKVRFGMAQIKKTPKTNQNNQPSAKRSILRKTPVTSVIPRRNIKNKKVEDAPCRKFPKTSSPDPNKQTSILHCEISTLLIEDCPPNKKQSKGTSSPQMTQDTEKLLDFEPIALQCSENIGENSREITPETCAPVNGQSSSVKRRRRLSYHFDENIPACLLLDHPVAKTKKKAAVWFGKSQHHLSLEELESFESDILL